MRCAPALWLVLASAQAGAAGEPGAAGTAGAPAAAEEPAAAGEPGASGASGGGLEALGTAAPPCDAARAHCLGLKLHVAMRDQRPVADPDWVARQLAHANRHFEPIGVGFQVVGVEALPETAARIEDAGERTALGRHVAGTVIDVFVTAQLDDIDKKDGIIYGVAWPKGGKKYVILSTMAWERTLAHELGHVFGLPHSAYAISIMNKTERKAPPLEQRTFHANELAVMRAQLARMLREKVIARVAPAGPKAAAPVRARP